jgi:hypothetical protein
MDAFEEIRPRRHTGDDLGDLVNVAGLRFELEDHATGLLHTLEDRSHLLDGESGHVDTRVGLMVRLGGEAEGLASSGGVHLDRRGDVRDQTVHVLDQGLLVRGALRDVRHRGGDLLGGRVHPLDGSRQILAAGRDPIRGDLHVAHHLAKVLQHLGDAAGELVYLIREAVSGGHPNLGPKISPADAIRRRENRLVVARQLPG